MFLPSHNLARHVTDGRHDDTFATARPMQEAADIVEMWMSRGERRQLFNQVEARLVQTAVQYCDWPGMALAERVPNNRPEWRDAGAHSCK